MSVKFGHIHFVFVQQVILLHGFWKFSILNLLRTISRPKLWFYKPAQLLCDLFSKRTEVFFNLGCKKINLLEFSFVLCYLAGHFNDKYEYLRRGWLSTAKGTLQRTFWFVSRNTGNSFPNFSPRSQQSQAMRITKQMVQLNRKNIIMAIFVHFCFFL